MYLYNTKMLGWPLSKNKTGYPPSHPFYYFLRGPYLTHRWFWFLTRQLSKNAPHLSVANLFENALSTNQIKQTENLRKLAREGLREAIEAYRRYRKYRDITYYGPEYPRRHDGRYHMARNVHTNASLAHNHILYAISKYAFAKWHLDRGQGDLFT